MGSQTAQIMCPHSRTSVSELLLTQGNMVTSCSSAFYPQTFCHTAFFFFFQTGRKLRAVLSSSASFQCNSYLSKGPGSQTEILTLMPLVLLRVPGPALTGFQGEEMPSHASSWLSADLNPLAIWSLLPAMHTAWSGKWKLSVGFSIFYFFANQDAWKE